MPDIFGSRYSKYLTGVFLFLLPLIYSPLNIDPALIPRYLALAAFLFLIYLMFLVQQVKDKVFFELSVFKSHFFVFLSVYVVVSVFSLTQTINLSEGIFEVAKLSLHMLTFIAFFQLFRNDKNTILYIIKALILSNIIMLMICTYQYHLAWNKYPFISRIFFNANSISSTMANKNLLSSACFLMIPFISYGMIKFKGYWKYLSVFIFTYLILCILLLQVRSTWIATLVATAITVLATFASSGRIKIYLLNNIGPRKKIFIAAILITIVSSTAITLYPKLRVSYVYHRGEIAEFKIGAVTHLSERSKYTQSLAVRYALWDKTWEMIKENPMGVGIGNWKINFPKYTPKGLPTSAQIGLLHFQRPHNDYLWVWSETSLIGLLSYLAMFVVLIWYILKLLSNSSDNDEDKRTIALLVLYTISGYLTFSFFSFPKERIFDNVIILIMVAWVMSTMESSKVSGIKLSKLYLSKIIVSAALLISFVNICYGFARERAEIYTGKAISLQTEGKWAELIKVIDKVNTDLYNINPMSAPVDFYRGTANFNLKRVDLALKDFEAAYKIHPNHTPTLINLATCYELKGNHRRAIEYYQKAIAISPGFDKPVLNLCAVLFNQGRIEDAYLALRACRGNKNNPNFVKTLNVILPAKIDLLLKSPIPNETKQNLIRIKSNQESLFELHGLAANNYSDIDELIIRYAADWTEKE